MLLTPDDSVADWAGYEAAPTASERAVTGQPYPSLEEPAARLVLGDEGISITDEGQVATVRFDACAAVLAWPDGARQFIGTDGISVRAEPTLYHGLAPAIPWLDARVPYPLRCAMPPRDRIPQPRPVTQPGTAPAAPAPRTGGKAGPTVTIVLLSPVALVAFLFALVLGLMMVSDTSDLGVSIGLTVFFALIAGGAGVGVGLAIRRLRRR